MEGKMCKTALVFIPTKGVVVYSPVTKDEGVTIKESILKLIIVVHVKLQV